MNPLSHTLVKYRSLVLVLCAGALFLCVVYITVDYLRDRDVSSDAIAMPEDASVQPVDPTGTLYLSLAQLSTSSIAHRALYTLDVSTGELNTVVSDENIDYFEPVLDATGNNILFVTSPATTSIEKMVYGDVALSELVEIPLPPEVSFVRSLAFSPDGTQIAFVGAGKEVASFSNIAGQNVYIHDIKTGTTTRIASDAVSPAFTPNGSLIVLREDGVRLLDRINNTNTVVLPSPDHPFEGTDYVSLAPDGTSLVLGLPSRRTTVVYTISSYAPFTATRETTFDTGSLGAVFSPDSKSFATILYDEIVTEGQYEYRNHRIAIVSIDGERNIALKKLSDYYPGLINLGAWK